MKKICCFVFSMLSIFLSLQKVTFVAPRNAENNNVILKDKSGLIEQTNNFDYQQYNTSGMLYGIDAIKSDSTGQNTQSKLGSSVFKRDFIQDELEHYCYLNTGVNGASSSFSYVTKSNSMRDYVNSFYTAVCLNSASSAGIDLFKGGIANEFKSSLSLNHNQNIYSFFYSHYAFVQRYNLIIQNTYDKVKFINNLSSNFVNQIKLYLNGSISYSNFANQFGTHVLTSAFYGGLITTFFCLSSSNYVLDATLVNKLASSITGGIENIAESSYDYRTSFRLDAGINIDNTENKLQIKSIGGGPLIASDFDKYHTRIDSWSNSLTDNTKCAITRIENLLPLWELLPNGYNTETNKNKMISDFIDYANDNNINYSEFVNKDISEYSSLTLNYASETRDQNEEYVINDDGVSYQKYDIINLDSLGFDVKKDLYDNDYRYLEITLHLGMKEINYGYQEVCVYNSFYGNNPISKRVGNFIGNERSDDKFKQSEVCLGKHQLVNFIDYDKRKLFIKYGAKGPDGYSWSNKNFVMAIKFSKC